MIEALESHTFEPLRVLQWRNPDLDFSSVDACAAVSASIPASAA